MKKIYLNIIILLVTVTIYQQTLSAGDKYSAYEGTHFYMSFMQNEIELYSEPYWLQLFITASSSAKIYVNLPYFSNTLYTIKPDSVLILLLPSFFALKSSEIVTDSLIEITSDVPISVYAFNSRYLSSDSYTGLPVSQWGTEYVVMSMPNDQYIDIGADSIFRATPRNGEFLIMSAYDSTIVNYSPTAMTNLGKQYNTTYTVKLNKGETFFVKSLNAQKETCDLTGTIIKSNKPIGVLSGHERTSVPQISSDNKWDSKDHLVEMLSPVSAWGVNFISVPFGVHPRGDYFKITAYTPNTIVTLDTGTKQNTYLLNNSGSYVTIPAVASQAKWRSNHPIQIGQFMRHYGDEHDTTVYDPALVMVPPIEQFVTRILFQTPANYYVTGEYKSHYATVIMNKLAYDSLRLDNVLLKDLTTILVDSAVVGTPYRWVRLSLLPGKHEFITNQGGFTGVLYGTGYEDSYAMSLGSSLINPFKQDSIPPTFSYNESCGTINGTFKEYMDSNASGIQYIYVKPDSTFNYNYSIGNVTDTSTIVNFTASPVSLLLNGAIVIEVWDRNGNVTFFRYSYKGIRLAYPSSITFNPIDVKDSVCQEFFITNTNDGVAHIGQIYPTGSSKISLSFDKTLPIDLQNGDTIKCKICFKPDGDSTDASGNIVVSTTCLKDTNIPYFAPVIHPQIITIGYDFGKEFVGSDTCNMVYIINTGNVPIMFDSLVMDNTMTQLALDTAGMFPMTIQPKDSLKIKVCFTPSDRIDYTFKINSINNYNLKNQIIVTGAGVAPKYNDLIVDWYKRRIGLQYDTTAYMENIGNVIGSIKYNYFSEIDTSFDTTAISQISSFIYPMSSYELYEHFKPQDTGLHVTKAVLKSSWTPHPPINLELRGIGTLPTIKTYNYNFDTIPMFYTKSANCGLVLSGGNEKLTIDSIYYLNGDYNSFTIDYNSLKNLVLNQDSTLQIPINFKPEFLGQHEITLEVISDAAPAYKRVKSEITIKGYAILADTFAIRANYDIPVIMTCQESNFNWTIKNIGNLKIAIDTIYELEPKEKVKLSSKNIYPIILNIGDSIKFDGEILCSESSSFNLIIKTKISDEKNNKDSILEIAKLITPQINNIQINSLPDINVTPGDTIKLKISGKFPNGIDATTNFLIEINAKMKTFFALTNQTILKIKNSQEELVFPVEIIQDLEKITLKISNVIKFNEASEWNLELPLLVLLSDEDSNEISLDVLSNDCFTSNEIKFIYKYINICAYNLRLVQPIDGIIPIFNVNPNPATEKIKIDLKMPADDDIKFTIFDENGKKYLIFEKLFLKKGNYSFIFEISELNNGLYLLLLETTSVKLNKIFFKTK